MITTKIVDVPVDWLGVVVLAFLFTFVIGLLILFVLGCVVTLMDLWITDKVVVALVVVSSVTVFGCSCWLLGHHP